MNNHSYSAMARVFCVEDSPVNVVPAGTSALISAVSHARN